MKEYSEASRCTKCGFIDTPMTDYSIGIFDPASQENTRAGTFGGPIKEYLLRTCRRCGYKWQEKVISA